MHDGLCYDYLRNTTTPTNHTKGDDMKAMKQGDVCWVVEYTGTPEKKVVKTRILRVIDAHPGRSSIMIKTDAGHYVTAVAVFDHKPRLVVLTDALGSISKWV